MENVTTIEVLKASDESVSLLELDGFEAWILAAALIPCGVVTVGAKSLVINFMIKYAPKGRPINTMTLMAQVRIFKSKLD